MVAAPPDSEVFFAIVTKIASPGYVNETLAVEQVLTEEQAIFADLSTTGVV